MPSIVVVDANVLFSAPLRDLVMQLAVADLFRARWTDDIHFEWMHALRQSRPDLDPDRLEITRQRMNSHVRDCLVVGFEHLMPNLNLPDRGDHHVLAAAIHCGANAILTFNLDDFPESELGRYGIEPVHPDLFLTRLLDEAETSVCDAIRRQLSNLRNPPKSPEDLIRVFHRQGLVRFAAALSVLVEELERL
jgi:hypothetical protein